MEFVLPPVAEGFNIYAKTSKMNYAFASLNALLFHFPSWSFYVLYYDSRAFLRHNTSSMVLCTKLWFFSFKVLQIFIVHESAAKMGIFGRLKAE